MRATILSLCSGYGGLDLAVEALTAGRVVAHAETDPHASRVLAARWPGVPNLGDITTAAWPDADVITAGYPCQPFSQAGRRKGTSDVRHLWPFVRAAVRDVRPRLVVLENVDGHRSLGFDVVLGDLASLGFDVEWGVLRASDVGACHARARLWVVAYPRGERAGWVDRGLPPPASGARRQGEHVRAAVDDLLPTPTAHCGGRGFSSPELARHRHDVEHRRNLEDVVAMLLPTPTARDGKGHNQRRDDTCLTGALLPTPRVAASRTSRSAATRPDSRSGPSIAQAIECAEGVLPREFESWDELPASWSPGWAKYLPAMERHAAVLGRTWPHPTVTGRNGQPALNPAFVEWMMMLPDGWITDLDIPRTRAVAMLGNGVVPAQAYAAVGQLLERAS